MCITRTSTTHCAGCWTAWWGHAARTAQSVEVKTMMSVESIVELSRRAGNTARRLGVKPFIATAEDLARYDAWFFAGNIPNIGAHRPRGWTMGDRAAWRASPRGEAPGAGDDVPDGWPSGVQRPLRR